MRLLVYSHACVTPINQALFADLMELTGWEVSLVIPSSWSTDYARTMSANRYRRFTGPIYPIPVWKRGNVPLHTYKANLIRHLKATNPDVIYVHNEPYALSTLEIGVANALTLNRPLGFYAAQNLSKDYPPPFRWFEQFVFSHSRFAVPVSQGALDVLMEKKFRGFAEVLPLQVDLDVYRHLSSEAKAYRSKLRIAEDEFVIGYVGRVVEEKGLSCLMKALHELPSKGWRCVIVGTGPYLPDLRAEAESLGLSNRVHYVGYVEHERIAEVLSMFDVFVLPSETRQNWKEQFGRVIVEANACRTPVIGSNSGEIANVIRETGGGLVFNESDHLHLAELITRLIENPEERAALGETGERQVRKKFEGRHIAGRLAKIIRLGSV